MAMNVAAQLNVSPWDALLLEVRRSAGRCAWLDARLAEDVSRDETRRAAEHVLDDPADVAADLGGLPAGVRSLLRESRNERRHLAVVSKAAIDAGVAERLVRQVELEGQLVAAAIVAGLDVLALDPDQRARALAAAHARLTELETGTNVVDGDPPELTG